MTYGIVAAGDSSKTGRVGGMLVRTQGTSFSGNDGTTFAALESSNSPIFYRCAVLYLASSTSCGANGTGPGAHAFPLGS